MNAPYPVGSEVADGHLTRAIESLDRRVSEGFARVESRIDSMVTKEAFEATIQRLDAKDEHLDTKIEDGFKNMDVRVAQGFADVKAADRERNTKNRWFWTLLVAMAGVVSGVVFGVVSLIVT